MWMTAPQMKDLQARRVSVLDSDSSRRVSYCSLNQSLEKHSVYETPSVPEYARIAFSRIRLSSHRLKVETGRWSRIPKENRLCECGKVQTEEHVLIDCPMTAQERNHYPQLNFSSVYHLMQSQPVTDLAMFCYKVLEMFK